MDRQSRRDQKLFSVIVRRKLPVPDPMTNIVCFGLGESLDNILILTNQHTRTRFSSSYCRAPRNGFYYLHGDHYKKPQQLLPYP